MTLFRAAILNSIDARSWRFLDDGGLLVEDGVVRALGCFDDVVKNYPWEPVTLDGVILPGFADIHIHWVQHAVRGRYAQALLPWLATHIWPEEARYGDTVLAQKRADEFYADCLAAGTVMGMSYSSPHPQATHIAHAARRGDWITGNVVMTTNAPAELVAASVKPPADLAPLSDAIGRMHYAITPRFALNCTADDLAALGAYARHQGLAVQTHLAESVTEVREVERLFPQALDYTDVYDRAGLLGPRTVLGHCLHLSPREWSCLKARGCWIAHCPSSNEALDSGRFDLDCARRHQVPFALASDVGAGPSHSMLHVMQRFRRQHEAAGVRVDPEEILFRATLAGARAMGRGAVAGSLDPGRRADFVLMPRSARPQSPQAWFEDLLEGSPTELEQRPLGTWIAGHPVFMGARREPSEPDRPC
ncbi:amidohydrolase family protein [Acidiferrobacter sp.]|jgi:guanine deaminase|uniref:amidohydrolase family protein n=1 Tax=Acidiferrobacter sp. TaxID=1872107 RepID=UPI002610D072|nr:amidohydrolase family protein [Acidiferrobacter sp.]